MLNPAFRENRLVGRACVLLALLGTTAIGGPALAQGQHAEPPAQATADTGSVRYQAGPLPPQTSFAVSQLRHERVLNARVEARFEVKRLFRERGLRYPAEQIFMRIFKRERQLELWVQPAGGARLALLKTYDICALAGELGPKRRQGDEQVPEGFYYIDHFNPQSDYLLSLHLDYPNRSDMALGQSGDLGGDIYIHGGCNSAGCLALTDQAIQEVYWLSVEARGAGQSRIPVHIFPARLTDTELPLLAKAFRSTPRLISFWQNLKPGYDYFERERRVPRMSIAANGSYQLAGEERFDGPAPLGSPVPGRGGPQPIGAPVSTGATSSPAATNGGSPQESPGTGPGDTPANAGPTGTSANSTTGTPPSDSIAVTPLGTPGPRANPPGAPARPAGGG